MKPKLLSDQQRPSVMEEVQHSRGEVNALRFRKSKMISGLLETSFGSVGIYDILTNQIIYSQWLLLTRLGYGQDEFQRVSSHFFSAIRHSEDEYYVAQLLNKIRSASPGEVLMSRFRLLDKKGNYHWIVYRCSVIRCSNEGQATQLIVSVIDITQYKAIKARIANSLHTINQLSFTNSHELRAPVATALGLLTLLKQENETDQELIYFLEKTILRIDQVIRDFSQTLEEASKTLKNRVATKSID